MSSFAETLRANISHLSVGRQEFARDLLRAYDARRATARQIEWIERLSRDAVTREGAAQPSAETAALLTPLFALFNQAKANGLTKPKPIHVLADAQDIALSPAPPTGKNAGSIYVKRNGQYLGKISPQGELRLSHAASGYEGGTIKQALAAFAADPAGVAAEYGKQTNHCCFCSLPLTDPRSVYVGYGPVCASNYGLAWGENDPNAPVVAKKARKPKKAGFVRMTGDELSAKSNETLEVWSGRPLKADETLRLRGDKPPVVENVSAPSPSLRTKWTKPVQLCLAL